MSIIAAVSGKILNLVHYKGYIGLFAAMFLESTCIPIIIPTEVVLLTAGYLVSKGTMTFIGALVSSVLGVMGGSISVYIAMRIVGSTLLKKYGKYIGANTKFFQSIESAFKRHSYIVLFCGRMLPVLKHYVAVPAGLYKINFTAFSLITLVSGTIFCGISLWIGVKAGTGMLSWFSALNYVGKIAFISTVLVILYFSVRFLKFVVCKLQIKNEHQ